MNSVSVSPWKTKNKKAMKFVEQIPEQNTEVIILRPAVNNNFLKTRQSVPPLIRR